MSDIEITMVPKDLYYHEVAYVRGLEKKNAELVAERDIAWASNTGLTTDVLALRAQNAELVAALEGVVNDVQAWCDAIEKNGTSWDDWDDHYKNFAYRGGLVRARAALAAAGQKTGGGA
jgi:hypothetical protein